MVCLPAVWREGAGPVRVSLSGTEGFMTKFEKRFWNYIRKADKCWLWTGAVQNSGYGYMNNQQHRKQTVHRISWELNYGSIPRHKLVCHHCDNKLCVRPSHLFIGTQADNLSDMVYKGRSLLGERHWSHLHPDWVTRGTKHGNAKLNPLFVKTIRRLNRAGFTYKELGARFGVSPTNIGAVVRRLTWRHV